MAASLPEGTLFAGRYRITRSIAAGAMGEVYEAIHIETNRRRALKVMHAHLFQSDEMRERFKREARIAADIESEYIVDVSDAGVDAATGMPFLVMELLRGEELGQRLKRLGRLPPAEVLTYLRQTAMALDRTHAASIVHRDLKPANLFLTFREDGSPRIKILDFGVAKAIAESTAGAAATQSLGTPLYMAPEQFMPEARLTGAADIYAFGMMAYTLLVGAPYWKREAAGGLMPFVVIAVRGPQEPPVKRAASWGVALPAAFDTWFARATAMDPAARFRTATEAVQALEWTLHGPDADLMARTPLPRAPAGAPAALPAFAPAAVPAPAAAIGMDPSRASSPHLAAMPPGAPGWAGRHFAAMPPAGPGNAAMRAASPVGAAGAAGPVGLQQASASTSAVVSPVRAKPSRAPFIAAAAVLATAAVGAGAWFFFLRPAGGSISAADASAAAQAASVAATGANAPSATVAVGPGTPVPGDPTAPPVAEDSAAPPVTQGPSAGANTVPSAATAALPGAAAAPPTHSAAAASPAQPASPGTGSPVKPAAKPTATTKKPSLDSLLGQH